MLRKFNNSQAREITFAFKRIKKVAHDSNVLLRKDARLNVEFQINRINRKITDLLEIAGKGVQEHEKK